MHFLYELLKSFLGYDRCKDYSDSLGLVDFAFALVNFESIILDHAFRTQLSNQPVLNELLFMSIRIRSLPPRKSMDPTDLEST